MFSRWAYLSLAAGKLSSARDTAPERRLFRAAGIPKNMQTLDPSTVGLEQAKSIR